MAGIIWNIPRVGTIVELKADWHFILYEESRNWGAFDFLSILYDPTKYHYGKDIPGHKAVFKKGTKLKVDRVYIRGSGYDDFNSLTFHLAGMKKVRFWAKLEDVRKMEIDEIEY